MPDCKPAVTGAAGIACSAWLGRFREALKKNLKILRDFSCTHVTSGYSARMKTNEIKNGQAVKITFGMGRTVRGQISDMIVNKWGTSYEVTTEDGGVEYVSSFNSTANEIGAFLL